MLLFVRVITLFVYNIFYDPIIYFRVVLYIPCVPFLGILTRIYLFLLMNRKHLYSKKGVYLNFNVVSLSILFPLIKPFRLFIKNLFFLSNFFMYSFDQESLFFPPLVTWVK